MANQINIPGAGYHSNTDQSINIPGAGYFTGLAVVCDRSSDVTSWFSNEIGQKSILPVRRMIIGSSDYSDRVKKWPSFKRDADKIRPVSLAVPLVNNDKALNYLINSSSLLATDVSLSIGLTHVTSGTEYVDLFNGTIEGVRMVGGTLTVKLMDRFKGFSETLLGDSSSGGNLSYTGSDYFPGDLAWDLITAHGGLDATSGSANTDIDYDSWVAWKTLFEDDQIIIKANFTAQKMTDAMVKLGKLTDSAILFENNRLRFYRNDILAKCYYTSIGDGSIKDIEVNLDDKKIVNRQLVKAGYNVDSGSFGVNVIQVDSASQATFSVRGDEYGDSVMWLVNSNGAKNLAERRIYKLKDPFREFDIKTTLKPIAMLTNDELRFSDSQLDVSSETPHIMSGITIDMDTGKTTIKTKSLTVLSAFVLDVTTFSVLDQSYNYIL